MTHLITYIAFVLGSLTYFVICKILNINYDLSFDIYYGGAMTLLLHYFLYDSVVNIF